MARAGIIIRNRKKVIMPIPFKLDYVIERTLGQRSEQHVLRRLAGAKLSASEARAVWPRVLEHKWYMSERLSRDVGLRVAAIDYFENIQPHRAFRRVNDALPQRLPMMQSLAR